MIALFSLLLVLSVSLLIMRVGTVGLTLTGLSRESAQFQAQSAFLGVGFTARESEHVIGHPVRRRIDISPGSSELPCGTGPTSTCGINASLLRLAGEFSVIEMRVRPDEWLADKTLAEVDLRSEGALVLGIERADGDDVSAPRGPTTVRPGGLLIMYGRTSRLKELDRRPAGSEGDRAHREAVGRQRAYEGGAMTPSGHPLFGSVPISRS